MINNYDHIYIPWPGWKIVRLIGKGGFGNVYEIERDVFGNKESAALKIISIPQNQSDLELDYSEGYTEAEISQKYREYVGGIISEYQLMTKMKGHSNIVSCEDFYTMEKKEGIGWDIYIRMELLTPLLSVVKNREMTEEDILHLAKDMCKAIALCEKNQVVHRDIKPENIFLSNFGDYKLGDFGIARTMDHTTQATSAGTQRYMAPEILKHEKYGRDVDIYSLGLVLHWLLNNRRIPFVPTNRIPTAEETRIANEKRILGETIPAPVNGSSGFNLIILKACSYNPKDRYRSAEEMLHDLETLGTKVKREEDISVQESLETAEEACTYDVIESKIDSADSFEEIISETESKTNSWDSDPEVTVGIAFGQSVQSVHSDKEEESEEKTIAETVYGVPEHNTQKETVEQQVSQTSSRTVDPKKRLVIKPKDEAEKQQEVQMNNNYPSDSYKDRDWHTDGKITMVVLIGIIMIVIAAISY